MELNSNKKAPLFKRSALYSGWDLNPHDVAITGF